MADISMCHGEGCLRRDECYRYTSEADKYQSYGMFEQVCNEECGYEYIYILGGRRISNLRTMM